MLNKQCVENSGRSHFCSSSCSDDACWLGGGRDGRERRQQGVMVQTVWRHEAKTELLSVGNAAKRDKSILGGTSCGTKIYTFSVSISLFQETQRLVCAV